MPTTSLIKLLAIACVAMLAACTSHSFKPRAPFEKTSNGFWYRSDCRAFCDLYSDSAERERLGRLEEKLRQEDVCRKGYVLEKRTPLAITKTAPADVIVYEGRCRE